MLGPFVNLTVSIDNSNPTGITKCNQAFFFQELVYLLVVQREANATRASVLRYLTEPTAPFERNRIADNAGLRMSPNGLGDRIRFRGNQ